MDWRQHYFIWNNRRSFQRGAGQNIDIMEYGIGLCDGEAQGVYYTKICDGKNQEMRWGRLLLEGQVSFPHSLRISIYATDKPFVCVENRTYHLNELMAEAKFSIEQKDKLFQEYKKKEVCYIRDQLLSDIKGRFLWLRLQFDRVSGISPRIVSMQLWFPFKSWTEFLPDIYRDSNNLFMDCFLSVFQSMYDDMNRQIESIPGMYCAENISGELLLSLSDWLSVEKPYLWTDKQLRYLISNGIKLSEIRGTSEYMRHIIKLYTGELPYIVEYWQWAYENMDSARRRMMERLYGSDSFCAAVIVSGCKKSNRAMLGVLEQLVQSCSPAHMDIKLEILQPFIFLGRHSYLGINSYLEGWKEACLDGSGFLSFAVIGGGKDL